MKNNNLINSSYQIYGINNCFNFLAHKNNYSIKKITIDKSSKINQNVKLLKLIDSINLI